MIATNVCRPDCRPRRRLAELEVERCFGELFHEFECLAPLFRIKLFNDSPPDGDLHQFMAGGSQAPGIDFLYWLLDDLGIAKDQRRLSVEKDLFAAGVFLQSLILLDDHRLLEDPVMDRELQWLRHPFASIANRRLSNVCESMATSEYITTAWSDYASSRAWYANRHMNRARTFDIPGDLFRLGNRAAPLRLPCIAALLANDRESMIPGLTRLIDGIHAEFHLLIDVFTMRADLAAQIYSVPIVAVMQASGIDLNEPTDENTLIGAAVLTGAVGRLATEAGIRLDALEEDAMTLNLPTFAAYVAELRKSFGAVAGLFCLSATAGPLDDEATLIARVDWPDDEGTEPFFLPRVPLKELALTMASEFLQLDLTFHESWEVHNWGFLGSPRLTSSMIPIMFVLDNLGEAGKEVSQLVTTEFARVAANGLHYFSEPNGMFPDADTLNGTGRLLKYSKTPELHAAILEPMFRWLESNIGPNGEIPVFFSRDVSTDTHRLYSRGIIKFACGTICANTVSSLIEIDAVRFRSIIDGAVSWLSDAILSWGPSSNRCYTHTYWSWVTGACLDRYLGLDCIDPKIRKKAVLARNTMDVCRNRLARQGRPTPQQAAFRLLAGQKKMSTFERRYLVDVILKEQRSDGGWLGEPFYFMPGRGNGTQVYESRLLSSSFCFRALSNEFHRADSI